MTPTRAASPMFPKPLSTFDRNSGRVGACNRIVAHGDGSPAAAHFRGSDEVIWDFLSIRTNMRSRDASAGTIPRLVF